MNIPDYDKKQVTLQILNDLEAYYDQANEMEDHPETSDVTERRIDFYVYMNQVLQGDHEPDEPDESWTKLLEWAKGHDKTEKDIHVFFATTDTATVKELSTEDLMDGMMQGGFRSTLQDAKDLWMTFNEEEVRRYQDKMLVAWSKQS